MSVLVSRLAPLALCTLLLANPSPVSSQEDDSRFGDVVDVQVIDLEVVVTGRSGKRVEGLGPDDFRVLVDGQEVPIAFFGEVRDGRKAALAEPGVAARETAPNHYLIFVDDDFGIDSRRRQILGQMRDRLSDLRPEDRVGLVSFDGARLRGTEGWLAPGPELEAAFGRLLALEGRGIDRLVERRQGVDPRDLEEPATDLSLGEDPTLFRRNLRWQAERPLGRVMLAAVEALQRFDAGPGRKSMLLLAGNWPDAGILSPYGQALGGPAPYEAFDLYRPLVETANLRGWTLYPVSVDGFVATPSSEPPRIGAQEGGNPHLAFVAPVRQPSSRDPNRGDESRHQLAADSDLRYLAGETGGRAALYDRRFTALGLVLSDTRSYYSIGIAPARRGDDGRHSVEIEVLRPQLDVRSRRGYMDLSTATAGTMASLAARAAGGSGESGE